MTQKHPIRRRLFRQLATALAAVILAPSAEAAGGDPPIPAALLTTAERSEYRATARHAEVVALLDRLAESSPLAKRGELGVSGEGRTLPLLIIADPPVATPEQARRQIENDGKLLVFAIGNIHAGEVDGKEALPMVARELLLTPHHPLLRSVILAIAPIYNADGNERVSPDNRPGQLGPEEGMGRRENAAGLDLNRDFIKLEAPETRALVDFLNRWDPHIFIDTHTTNGCWHRYVITYEGPKCLAGNAGLIRWCRDEMMPAIARDMLAKYQVPSFVYGDFNLAHTKWETYPAQARYSTSYVGLRGRISVLSEGYSYATYKTRVLGTRDFVKSILEFAAANREAIRTRLADVDRETIAAAAATPRNDIALRSEVIAAPQKTPAAGFIEELQNGHSKPTSQPYDYNVELWTHYKPTVSVPRPFAYAIPTGETRVIEKLRQHGVEIAELSGSVECPVEVFSIETAKHSLMPFQGHKLAYLDGVRHSEKRTLPAGTILVRTGQRLGNLVVYMLEPQCDDGLAAWNYFDEGAKPGGEFPVLRIPSAVDFLKR
ncbi:MAG: M14 family metallopeptidase [Planctomycetes bacterium]|nr:M14 family metallopeptidase [Planctomycetota bacterium]